MKQFAKFLYWKLCFPKFVTLAPLRLRVVSGPFQGMPYVSVACASAHSAKVLGTYEKELHAIIDEVQRQHFDKIIDIGAAEGYYAVGLARLNPNPGCQIIAFEAQDYGRQLLGALAASNGVSNLEIRGACDRSSLAKVVSGGGRKLIVCDVEGFESELLDPQLVPYLLQCSILVELHDSPDVPVSSVIRKRFEPSHRIQEVISTDRTWRDFPEQNLFSRLLPRSIALRAMNEARDFQRWFWMQPSAQ
jgi:hypothetical protein